MLGRRTFLRLSAGVTALASASRMALANVAVRVLPGNKTPGDLLIHNDRPWGLETRRSAFGIGPITPRARFFVRNNLPMPDAAVTENADAWVLSVAGVAQPGDVTLGELKRLGATTVASVVQCSGNGRAFFAHAPSGSPWGVGAAGCALWTGVSVAAVLDYFGGAADAHDYLTARGGESLPDGIDPAQVMVERSVPLAKGRADAILAWEMNGAPLGLSHGGPLRLIVPGYFGVNSVKWVRRLAATLAESAARIQQKGYRVRPIGESGGPAQPSMWRMPVKSWINGPGADGAPLGPGPTAFYGYAFSGERGVARVEVSSDGTSWRDAEFIGPDLGPNAWRPFAASMQLAPGQATIFSRAHDTQGEVQPRAREENHRGYRHNGWFDHGLTVRVANSVADAGVAPVAGGPAATSPGGAAAFGAVGAAKLSALGRAGRAVYLQSEPPCGACHQLADAGSIGATGPSLDELKPSQTQTRTAVAEGVGVMPAFADGLSVQEIEALATYIAEATQ